MLPFLFTHHGGIAREALVPLGEAGQADRREGVEVGLLRQLQQGQVVAIIHIVLVNYGPGHTESLLTENCLSRLIVVVISEDHLNPASLGTMRSSQHKLGRGLKIEVES